MNNKQEQIYFKFYWCISINFHHFSSGASAADKFTNYFVVCIIIRLYFLILCVISIVIAMDLNGFFPHNNCQNYGCNNCEWNQKWFYSQFEWTPNWIAAIKKFTNAIEKYRFVSSFVIGCFKQSPFILRHFERCIVRYCRDRPLYSFSLCFLLMFSSLNHFISLIYFRFYSQYRCAYCLARAYYNWTNWLFWVMSMLINSSNNCCWQIWVHIVLLVPYSKQQQKTACTFFVYIRFEPLSNTCCICGHCVLFIAYEYVFNCFFFCALFRPVIFDVCYILHLHCSHESAN